MIQKENRAGDRPILNGRRDCDMRFTQEWNFREAMQAANAYMTRLDELRAEIQTQKMAKAG
jgi:hypothetical protein